MRILHTSDWHLGKSLMGFSRLAEQEAFCDEVVRLAQDVDLVVLSGDVFDTYNPPIDAEELLYETLARLGDHGRRAVVVIAGNHDSPDRLTAPGPLCTTHGVFLFGRPGDVAAQSGTNRGGIGVQQAGPSALTLALPCGQTAVIAALPYPSEARLRTLLSQSIDERDLQAAYQLRLKTVLGTLGRAYRPDTVNLVASHLTMTECLPSESERTLVGGSYQVNGSIYAEGTQYVALGHLHRPQDVPDTGPHVRYCGAPLAFRMSEREVARTHTVVTVDPGTVASVEEVPVESGRPLVLWEATDGLDEVIHGVEAGRHADAFIDLRLHLPTALDHASLALLRRLPRDFIRIRTVLPKALQDTLTQHRDIPPDELFKAFVRDTTQTEPDPELVSLFVELTSGGEDA